MSVRQRIRDLSRSDGFTIIEVTVAALIAVVAGLAVMGSIDAASRNTYRAQQSQVVNDRLQSEMEKIKRLPYSQIALTSAPVHSTAQTNPGYRVNTASFAVSRNGTNAEQLVYNGGANHDQGATGDVSGGTICPGAAAPAVDCSVTPFPSTFTSGDVSGKIYRYVTWQQDTACQSCGQPWVKHVVVAISLDSTAAVGTRTYQEIQSDVSNPDAKVRSGGPAGGGTTAQPWTFWLTDTTCDFNSRQPITGDHPTHNTRGKCATGAQTNNTPGAPDLMFTQAAPISQPIFDYASDVEPTINPNQDQGIQLRNGPACGSLSSTWGTLPLTPDSDPTYAQQVHKWVSEPIPSGYDINFTGIGELDLWTQTINNATQDGSICVYLFYRRFNNGNPVDTQAVNLDYGSVPWFSYTQSPWPTNWTELHIPLHFDLRSHLLPGDRVGLAINVNGNLSGTGLPNGGLQFLYDQPSFDSRLQLQTSSALPF